MIFSELFSAVITQSGSALEYWAIDPNPLVSFSRFAEICGCLGSTTEETIACLKNDKSGAELADCTREMDVSGSKFINFKVYLKLVHVKDNIRFLKHLKN